MNDNLHVHPIFKRLMDDFSSSLTGLQRAEARCDDECTALVVHESERIDSVHAVTFVVEG